MGHILVADGKGSNPACNGVKQRGVKFEADSSRIKVNEERYRGVMFHPIEKGERYREGGGRLPVAFETSSW